MNDDWDSNAQTIKPPPRFSQRITVKIPPPLPIQSIAPPKKKNWDTLTLIIFIILILIAIILYIYVNQPFKYPADNVKIIYSTEPVLISAPITSTEITPKEQKIEPILNPINSVQMPLHIIKKSKIESKDKDYGI